MKQDLTKQDLTNLVKGVAPFYNLFLNPLVRKSGDYNGSHDKWTWHYGFEKDLTEQELWDLYVLCRDSWSK
jgi:hypothetical protein